MKTIYTIITLIVFVALSNFAFTQSSSPKAEQYMQNFEYSKAIETFQNHFKTNTPNPTDIRYITYCYMKINDTKSAESWFVKLINSEAVIPEDVIIYADLLKSEGKYEAAILQYQNLKAMDAEHTEMADEQIAICHDIINWKASEPDFMVTNEKQLNSENADFGLIPFNDGFLLTSDRMPNRVSEGKNATYEWTGNPYLKLYKVNRDDSSNVESISFIPEINHDYHNGPGYFNDETNKLYFTRTKSVKKKFKTQNPDPTAWFKEEADIYTNRLEIYTAEWNAGKWENINAFEHNNIDNYSVGHPTLSTDGKTMYFVSDMPGGFGETDIYFCKKEASGNWSKPQNLGSKINTKGKEMFPTFDTDGSFYFSSTGHAGMGGLDIFKVTGEKTSWSEPENLKYPINSPKDDFAIAFTEPGEMGYFASNRYGGVGNDDIYSFVYSPPPPPAIPNELTLVVETFEKFDDGSLQALPGINVHYHAKNSDTEINIPEISPAVYHTKLACNETYMVHGTNPIFFALAQEINTSCETMNDTIFVDLIFERIVIDKAIVIENIYYDYNKWNIRPDAAIELDKIVTLLTDNPQIIIELGSHTDSRGTKTYNEWLSQQRAESAVTYIISKGISEDRITAKGYGEYELVNHCSDGVQCTDDEHQMNRRTEFKVTGFSEKQPVIHSTTQ
jgi:outer membrane protein OmpA-like peptidoglycan-associated protein/tetratricopeptide (TPR) repeat protein